jgi:hypothetical protein
MSPDIVARILTVLWLAAALLAALEPPARAGSTDPVWKEIYPGVKSMRIVAEVEEGPVRFYAIAVDLEGAGAEVVVSPPKYIGSKPSSFARAVGAQLAINGGFWTLVTHKPLGLLVTAGRRWKESVDDKEHGFLAVGKDGSAWISPPEEVVKNPGKDIVMALSGTPMIVRDGKVGKTGGCGYVCMKHPRAAVGLDAAGTTLYLVATDGRQEDSVSIGLETLAELMIGIGVKDGLNLDGGGSATLYVEKQGGVINRPCDGRERGVLSSLAILLRPAVPIQAAAAAGPAAASAVFQPFLVPRTAVAFSDDDFEKAGTIEMPPRAVGLVKAGFAAAGVILLVVAAATIMAMRRRKKGRAGVGSGAFPVVR